MDYYRRHRSKSIHVFFYAVFSFLQVTIVSMMISEDDQSNTRFEINIDNSSVFFPVPYKVEQYMFEFIGNGGIAKDFLQEFCNNNKCSIPLVFGGNQSFTLYKNQKVTKTIEFKSGENLFYCIENSWERRICRLKGICIENNNMTFISPYHIVSDSPFIVLGARPPPYDKKRDRVFSLRVNKTARFPEGYEVHNETTHYFGTYYNIAMLWHMLFDCIVPLFHTTTLFEASGKRTMLMANTADKPNSNLIKSFSNGLKHAKNGHCYKDFIVGISKVKNEGGKEYEFPRNFTYKWHPGILKQFKLNSSLPEKPIILLIGRKTKKRIIINFEAILLKLTEEFPNYYVRPIYFEELKIPQQIDAVYHSSIMIGMHGSGLSHVAWMRPNSIMIELFPYKFECRDWYEKASVVSGVKYYKYIPSDPSESPNATTDVQLCWERTEECSDQCLDKLRDQNLLINESKFIQLVNNVVNK